jgi:hypothetical protein
MLHVQEHEIDVRGGDDLADAGGIEFEDRVADLRPRRREQPLEIGLRYVSPLDPSRGRWLWFGTGYSAAAARTSFGARDLCGSISWVFGIRSGMQGIIP